MALEKSILKNIRKLMGLGAENTAFDPDLIIHINSVFSILNSEGIGPVDGFAIDDETADWDAFFANDAHNTPVISEGDDGTYIETTETITVSPILQNSVKSLVYIKVRLLFDPPSNGNLLSAMKENARELEIRLYTLKGGY